MFIFTNNSYIDVQTILHTSKGLYTIFELYDKNIFLWNGKLFESRKIEYAGIADLYEIALFF